MNEPIPFAVFLGRFGTRGEILALLVINNWIEFKGRPSGGGNGSRLITALKLQSKVVHPKVIVLKVLLAGPKDTNSDRHVVVSDCLNLFGVVSILHFNSEGVAEEWVITIEFNEDICTTG